MQHVPMAESYFKYIFMLILIDKNIWISIQISLKFCPKGPDKTKPSSV